MEETNLPISRFRRFLRKIGHAYKDIPHKKQYVEFITAILSVPILLTVLWTNVSGLNKDKTVPTPTQAPTQIVVTTQAQNDDEPKPTAAPTATPKECDRGLPELNITYPEENAEVSDNPVSIELSQIPDKYCAIVWSYRINGGRWSDYDDKAVALYNVPNGKVTIELRVKNIASGTEKTLKRVFTYTSSQLPTPTSASQNTQQ